MKSDKGLRLHACVNQFYGVPGVFNCGFSDLKESAGLERHAHDGYELTYISRGEVAWVLDREPRELRLLGGCAALTQPGVPHHGKWNAVAPSRLFWLIFDPRQFHRPGSRFTALSRAGAAAADAAFRQAGNRVWKAGAPLRQAFEECRDALQRLNRSETPSPLDLDGAKLILSRLILAAAEALRDSRPAPVAGRLPGDAADFIMANLARHLTVTAVARHLGVSRATLTQAFRDGAGISPGDYLRRTRCNQAMDWLADRRRSISEIAFQLAFPSAQYFATVFRRYTGMTPGQYRRQCG